MSTENPQAAGVLYSDPSISSPAVNVAQIHPLVVFKIADHYQRRGEGAENVVGLLLGELQSNEAVIRDVVPLDYGAERKTELVSASYNAHHVLFPNEKILGWYAFSNNYVEFPSIIAEGAQGIHLWLRPFVPPKIDCFAIFKHPQNGLISMPIQYVIQTNLQEQLAYAKFDKTAPKSTDQAIDSLVNLLQGIQDSYKKQKGSRDISIGRRLDEALSQFDMKAANAESINKIIGNLKPIINEIEKSDAMVSKAEEKLSLQKE